MADRGMDPYEFSLVLGGPLFQILRRAHLSGGTLELLRRRIVVIPLFAWLPLLILSAVRGRAWGDAVRVPFAADLEVHVRYLVVLLLLILAELVVHQRLSPGVWQFLERGRIPDTSRARFDTALPSAMRLRNSVAAEVLLIAFVYVVGVSYIWPRYVALHAPTWYSTPVGGGHRLSLAG